MFLALTALAAAQSEPVNPSPLFVSVGALEPIKTPSPPYPSEARDAGVQGQVVVQFIVSTSGEVERVDVISGDPMLTGAVVTTVKKWKYKPYVLNGTVIPVRAQKAFNFGFPGTTKDTQEEKPVTPATSPAGEASRVPIEVGVAQGRLIHQVSPVYPRKARSKGIQGTVVLLAVIGKDGAVHELEPISGPPELVPAAVSAVQQWRYKPFLLKGEAVNVQTQITVHFTLR